MKNEVKNEFIINGHRIPAIGDTIFCIRRTVKLNKREKAYTSRDSHDLELIPARVFSIRLEEEYPYDASLPSFVCASGTALPVDYAYTGTGTIEFYDGTYATTKEQGEKMLEDYKARGFTQQIFHNNSQMGFVRHDDGSFEPVVKLN